MPRTIAEIHARQRQIRELYATGRYTEAHLAAQFGFSPRYVHTVLAPQGDEFDAAISDIRARHRYRRKLTDVQIREIRERYRPHVVTARMLAEEYGVSQVLIYKILQNKHRPRTS